MIPDLHSTLKRLFRMRAPAGSLLGADSGEDAAVISFDLPDADWRSALGRLTLNCYLYEISENLTLRTNETLIQRNESTGRAVRRRPPARIDCSYCITAWSTAATGEIEDAGETAGELSDTIREEHQLLSDVLRVFLNNPTIPADVLRGSLVGQIPPYPMLVAASEGVKNLPDFWSLLDHPVKPSLTYVATLAMMLDDEPEEWFVDAVEVGTRQIEEVE